MTEKLTALWKTNDFGDALYHFDAGLTTTVATRLELKLAYESLLNGLDGLPRDSGALVLTAKLVLSIAEEDWTLSTASFKKLILDEIDGMAVLWLWYLGRKILESTAVARACAVPELIRRILIRVESQPQAHAPSS